MKPPFSHRVAGLPALQIDPPVRKLLGHQVAESILRAWRNGVFHEKLPSERALCAQLRVSRATIRSALAILEDQGLGPATPRRRRRLGATRRSSSRGKRVIILTPSRIADSGAGNIIPIHDLRLDLQKSGYVLSVQEDVRLAQRTPGRVLSSIIAENPADCWILWSLPPAVHDWFILHRLPFVVFGSARTETKASCIDLDHEAVAQHFVQTSVAYGHRSIALLRRKATRVGDVLSEQSFRHAAAPHDLKSVIRHHDETPESVAAQLRRFFRDRQPPTALLVSGPQAGLTTLSYLIHEGHRIPRDVSVAIEDFEPFLNGFYPLPSHYKVSVEKVSRLLSRMVTGLLRDGSNRPKRSLIMPTWVMGKTFAAAPNRRGSSSL